DRLEAALHVTPQEVPKNEVPLPPKIMERPLEAEQVYEPPTQRPPPEVSDLSGTDRASTPPHQFETRMGLTWINRVGVITLVLGVAFFFKLAVENQWIGEAGRIVLGILVGFATLGMADFLWHKDQKVFAHGISGAGIAILYLSFYAAFGFYHLVPQQLAFITLVLTTAMAVALSLRYNAAAIAALGFIGG